MKRYALAGASGRGLSMFARPVVERFADCAQLVGVFDVNPVRAAYVAEQADGVRVQGWLLRPAGVTEDALSSAVLEIHGGPQGMYGSSFFHEVQVLADKGYANPRGTTGAQWNKRSSSSWRSSGSIKGWSWSDSRTRATG